MIAASAGGKVPPQGPLNILVADGERHIVRLIQVNLQRQGHNLTCAFAIDEAISLHTAQEFDLVILGETLHPEGAVSLLKLVLNATAHNAPKIILLISKFNECDIPALYEAGAHLVLTKPFNPAELIARL
ncbi:MAG: response regulator transcription factor [Fimbriimonadaceae bacterium]|nr:response regulator transcription factor [Fimbriimonadaceae bacterium]